MNEGGILPELPKGWARVRLGEILTRIEAGKSYKCEPRPASFDEWGVIKVSAMTWGDFDESENKAVPAGFPFNIEYEIRPGDILLSRANTAAYVGASVLVRKCRPRLLLSDKSLRLVPTDNVDREWLAYLLSSPAIRDQISKRATGTKDSMRNISQGVLTEIECALPPFEEQRRIVAAVEDHLSQLVRAETAARSALVRAKALKRAILAEALFGRLVAQDGTDEPADVLIARTRAEREAASSSKSRSRSARRASAERNRTHTAATDTEVAPLAFSNPALVGRQPTLDLEMPS